MRTLAYAVIALVPSFQDVTLQPIWTEVEVVVLVDDQPIDSAEVTLDGRYIDESPCLVQLNNYFDHEINVFVDEEPVRERSRDLRLAAGARPSKIVVNFTSR
jgi:hypothetical protein